jgi:riboflavin synthase
MFTGIIEHLGAITRLDLGSSGGKLTVHAPTLKEKFVVSASIAVNGCCLTIVHHDADHFSADLSPETLAKTSFSQLKAGARVNLEQPLTAGKEFGGHFVLGHVDTIGQVAHLNQDSDFWLLGVHVPADFAPYIVSKGSVTIDGISLTVARWHPAHQASIAEIAVIPFTYSHTNLSDRRPGDPVNLEADILGKYIHRYTAQRDSASPSSPLTIPALVEQGF